jgi:hypothetical protein
MPENSVYIFDTSALIDMAKYYPIDRDFPYWRNVEASINLGRFRAPFFVIEDLTYDDLLKKWIEKRRKKIEIPITDFQNRTTKKIEVDYPRIVNYRAGRINSDPFVISCALEFKEPSTLTSLEPIIVAMEGEKKRMTIPRVCEKLGIICIEIDELWERENWVSE